MLRSIRPQQNCAIAMRAEACPANGTSLDVSPDWVIGYASLATSTACRPAVLQQLMGPKHGKP
jgi:hypothetical protein